MVPPEKSFVPLPEIVNPPKVPVVLRTMPLTAPLEDILKKFNPLAPIVVLVTLNAVPDVDDMVLLLPVTVITEVVAPVALNPVADPEVMARPPFVKFIAMLLFEARLTGLIPGVFNVLVLLVKFMVPPVLFETLIPVQLPVALKLPPIVTVLALFD